MEIILECILDLIDSELLKSKNVSHTARKFFLHYLHIFQDSLLISSLKKYILIEKVLLMLN